AALPSARGCSSWGRWSGSGWGALGNATPACGISDVSVASSAALAVSAAASSWWSAPLMTSFWPLCGLSSSAALGGGSEGAIVYSGRFRLLTTQPASFCRTWPVQSAEFVRGLHTPQEDSPDQIGQAITNWLKALA